ncbi:MAG: nucleotide exchange factor GrpE [Hyphomicrobiales bacterium]|nr:MAG: nucleotide exchange factor GrpE [Hyphomicrobiales bacterium]
MSDEPKIGVEPEEEGAEAEPAEAGQPESQLEALTEENAALKDRLLRAVAEMENLRKRGERERRDAGKYAISNFARDMLMVGDNLTRAMETLHAAKSSGAQEDLSHLVEGVEMTQREMLNIFERYGIRKLEPQGERFDPNLHQAMFEVPDPSVPNGTVAQVVQAGYVIEDRVLRPAMVGVTKGGPKEAPREAPAPAEVGETAAPDEAATAKPAEGAGMGANIDKNA